MRIVRRSARDSEDLGREAPVVEGDHGDGERQPEPSVTTGTGVEDQKVVAVPVELGAVAVAVNDETGAAQPGRWNVFAAMDHADVEAFEIAFESLGQVGEAGAAVGVAANREDRRDGLELVENGRVADVAGVQDPVAATEPVEDFGPQQAVGVGEDAETDHGKARCRVLAACSWCRGALTPGVAVAILPSNRASCTATRSTERRHRASGANPVIIEKRRREGFTVVAVEGIIKLGESARFFADALKKVFEEESGHVILDLAGINQMDSTGIGELVGYIGRFQNADRKLVLVRPTERIRKLIEVAQLDRLFTIYDDLDAAIEGER